MGRKRRQNRMKTKVDEDDDGYAKMPEPNEESEEYFNDDIETFALKNEKILLDQNEDVSEDESDYINDEEDEIMKLDSDESEVEDDEDDADDKVEQDLEDDDLLAEEDDSDEYAGLPSRKAWGSKKKEFYDSNLKDADHFENEEEEELAAEEEEKEAMALQQRMVSHLDKEDFDFFEPEEQARHEEEEMTEMEEETHVVKDLAKLSKEEKIQLLMKESPELFVLLDDYQSMLNEVIEKYHPLLLLARNGNGISTEGREFIEVMHQLLLNYCLNISFYLSLKAKRESVKDHPVIEKIVEYRNLLTKVEPLAKRFELQMNAVLLKQKEQSDIPVTTEQPSSKLDIKALAKKATLVKSIISPSESKVERSAKNATGREKSQDQAGQDPWEYYNSVANKAKEKKKIKKEAHELSMAIDDDENDDEETEGKRAITYEMAKNKGLIRKRKKENRNPRVKHKMKFKKAVVKRKSQVQAMRNEAVNYGGELTGIRARVTKGVKIK